MASVILSTIKGTSGSVPDRADLEAEALRLKDAARVRTLMLRSQLVQRENGIGGCALPRPSAVSPLVSSRSSAMGSALSISATTKAEREELAEAEQLVEQELLVLLHHDLLLNPVDKTAADSSKSRLDLAAFLDRTPHVEYSIEELNRVCFRSNSFSVYSFVDLLKIICSSFLKLVHVLQ